VELEELKDFGAILDRACDLLEGRTPAVFLAGALLKIRGRCGSKIALEPNRAQAQFERLRGQRNIVLKARQMGLSTWIAGRFFLKTITQPGTLTLEVAHTQEAAEDLFRMVHRFHAELPKRLREGALKPSRANARSLVFPRIDSEYRVETAWRPECRPGIDCAESPLFRSGTMAGAWGRNIVGTAGDAAAPRRGGAGVDGQRSLWVLLR
jgi:hypothetical protein